MPDISILIKVEGTALAEKTQDDLNEVIVDSTLSLPSSFMVTMYNENGAHDAEFDFGKKLEISIADPDDEHPTKPLITGIITAIEPLFSEGGIQALRIRGYDQSIKLTQGAKTRTFQQLKDSDIFGQVAADSGLAVASDSTASAIPHLIQYNQTDWDFILDRAYRLGYLVSMAGETLQFKKPASTGSAGTLTWGEDLTRFEPRLSFLGQLAKTSATGWDIAQKAAIAGSGSSSSGGPFRSILTSEGKSTVTSQISGKVASAVVDFHLVDASEASTEAQGLLNRAEAGYVTAEGECMGNPKLIAGCVATIAGISKKYAGDYLVTQVRHEYHHGAYITTFSANGATPETILNLLAGERRRGNRIEGVAIAMVTQTKDDQSYGRVKVKYPWLKDIDGTEVETDWVRIATAGAGKNRGIGFLPEINDEVLVAFADGDINAPYVVGALWNGKDTPPAGMLDGSGKIVQRVVRSRSGHVIILDDTDGSENITIKDKTGNNSITINSKDNSMVLQSDGDLTIQAKGKLTLKSNQDASFSSTSGKTEVKAGTELALTGTSKASLVGASVGKVDLQSSGTKLEGVNVEVSGTAQASLKGSAMVQIQGGLVKIN